MPRCIECVSTVPRLINPDTNTVERCSVCGESVDTYVEFGDTQRWIDMALLQKRAWVHAICNQADATFPYVFPALLCCALEAFVARSFLVLSTLDRQDGVYTDARVGNVSHSFSKQPRYSLQVVKILQNASLLTDMQYPTTFPRLLFYAVVEYVLMLVAAVALGSRLCPKDANYEEVLSQWVRAVSLASSVRVVYSIFLIWNVPVALLPVVDFLFLVWIARGVFVLTIDHSWVCGLPSILLFAGTRFFFRQLTDWSSFIMV